MAAGVLITLREGLEAFLVMGVLLGILTKIGQSRHSKYVWWGSAAAISISAVLAYLIQQLAFQFEGENAHRFELVVASLAVAVLSYMVTWMNRQSKNLKEQLERQVQVAVDGSQVWSLALLAFVTVLREGVETALFLSAVAGANEGSRLMTGAVLGLALAALITYLIMSAAVRLNLRKFFLYTGSLIVVIAGGLLAHIAGILNELGIVETMGQALWNLSGVVADESLAGKLLHAFTGYVAAPTILQMISYAAYLGMMLYILWRPPVSARPVTG